MNAVNRWWWILLLVIIVVALAIIIFGIVSLWDWLIEYGNL